jgi:hypothetical protein
MQRTRRWWALGAILLLGLGACSKGAASESNGGEPVKVARVAGTDLHRVELSGTAVERIGLETEPVTAAPAGAAGANETVIPYAALIYDPSGGTWVYTKVAPRAFQRYAVVVEHVDDEDVTLSAGPPVGTDVVTVGAAEVYGSEFLSEHE